MSQTKSMPMHSLRQVGQPSDAVGNRGDFVVPEVQTANKETVRPTSSSTLARPSHDSFSKTEKLTGLFVHTPQHSAARAEP